jgi:hypothetical protein
MSRLTLLAFCSVVLIDSLAAASDLCSPPEPCEVCVKSHDYAYRVGDRVTTYTHWSSTESAQIFSCTTKAPHLKCTPITTMCRKEVKFHDCKPTIVTREYASLSSCLEQRDVPIEAAIREYRCCTDCCGRPDVCTCLGPSVCVDEPNFCPRAVTKIIPQRAEMIECREVRKVCEFQRVTTKCDTDDIDISASAVGAEQTWTVEARSVPTGLVTLETKPAVHVVPVAPARCCAPCHLPCVSCKYTPCHRCRASEEEAHHPAASASTSTPTSPPTESPAQKPTQPSAKPPASPAK